MNPPSKRRFVKREEDDDRPDDSQDEAIEDRDLEMDEEAAGEGQEEEGEDLMENYENDYKEMDDLDRYNKQELDDAEYSDLDMDQKRRADRIVDERNRERQAYNKRLPAAFMDDRSEFSNELDPASRFKNRRGENYSELQMEEEYDADEEDDERFMDLDEMRGKLSSWINDPKTVRYIKKTFRRFLMSFKDEKGEAVYGKRINDMCASNGQSLEVVYNHLSQTIPTIAYWIFETPSIILPLLNDTAADLANKFYPGYSDISPDVFVRIRDFPLEEKIRDLRTFHLNTLIKITGVVTRRYPVYSQLKKVYYVCGKCGFRMGPLFQNDQQPLKLAGCSVCGGNGPFQLDGEKTIYGNYQKVTVQESPGTVLPGRVPRYKDVILFADMIDSARPGDEVEVVGIYANKFDYGMNMKHGFPVFSTFIEANLIKKVADISMNEISAQDKEEILRLARNPRIARVLINSIGPSIHGHLNIKTALALAMFGGEAQNINGSHRIRGDINVLLLGDPGLAKSQFLKYVEKAFHRTVYTTGKGASAVGLTASVRMDPGSREWVLEGGAMVLADQGVCLIDEFDKMSEVDRTSIHEAMEQQSISISKAGIVANLQARCAVVAAANPIKGRYDMQLSFADNVNLSEPILSRFDILCVLKDEIDVTRDTDLATFIINSHIKNHPRFEEDKNLPNLLADTVHYGTEEVVSQEMLKKYILYSRKHVRPRINAECSQRMTDFYAELRRESQLQSGISIVARHIESMIRIAQASARMHLRNDVRKEDVDMAISVTLESFLGSQKFSIAKALRKKYSVYINLRDSTETLLFKTISDLFNSQLSHARIISGANDSLDVRSIVVPLHQLREEARAMNMFDIDRFLVSPAFKSRFSLSKEGDIKMNA